MGWVGTDFDELSSPSAILGPWTYRSEVTVEDSSLEKVSDMEARRARVPDRNATPSMTAKVVRKNCLAWARTERQATRLTAQAPSTAEPVNGAAAAGAGSVSLSSRRASRTRSRSGSSSWATTCPSRRKMTVSAQAAASGS